MLASDKAARAMPALRQLVDNRYAQENLRDAAEQLRAAYRRASKRRVEPTGDEKVRERLRRAALYIAEARSALVEGRQKPKRRRGRRLLVVIGVGAIGAAAALAASEELRSTVFGDRAETQPRGDGAGPAPVEKVPQPTT